MLDSRLHPDAQLLICVLQDANTACGLNLATWDRLLRLARLARVLPRLATNILENGQLDEVPPQVRWHLQAERQLVDYNQRRILTELRCLAAVLEGLETPLVLLKGAGYLAADSPVAVGRTCNDVDVLVRHASLAAAESRLQESGWVQKDLPPKDARYFRRWLHESPPMYHHYRGVELDLHHTLLPRTDALQLDPQRLLDRIRPAGADSRFHVLCQPDLVLHAAAHLFRNGDFTCGLRDLLDIDALLRQSAVEPDGWPQLLDRACELNLQLPCWLAVRYCSRYLQTPVPSEAACRLAQFQPNLLAVRGFDRYVPAALFPERLDGDDRRRDRAVWLLAHYPLPRLRAMLTPLFWLKRLPAHVG